MTLWNLIRDFFVEHIFGGMMSNNEIVFSNLIGNVADEGFGYDSVDMAQLYIPFGKSISSTNDSFVSYISLGDWLSTTFTIITLILLVLFLYLFVKWIFKLFSGLLH